MAKTISDLSVRIGASTVGLSNGLKKARNELNMFSKAGKMIGAQLAGVFAVGGIVSWGSKAVGEYNKSIQAEKGLLNALNGRRDVMERLKAQAEDLQSRTIIEDDTIVEQQKFVASLGFSEDKIKQVIEAAVQLSAATGKDLDSSVKTLTGTYSGNARELGRMIPQIKGMTNEQLKSGAAVEYVLKNFKGYAEVAAKTGTGPLQQLKNNFGNLTEEVGRRLTPVVVGFAGVLNDLTKSLLPKGSDEVRRQKLELNSLVTAATDARISTEGRATAIKQISILYPEFMKGIDAERATNEQLAGRLRDVNAEYDKKIAYMVKEEVVAGSLEKIKDLQVKEVEIVARLAKAEKNLKDIREGNSKLEGVAKINRIHDMKEEIGYWDDLLIKNRERQKEEQQAMQEALAAYSSIYGNQIPASIEKTGQALEKVVDKVQGTSVAPPMMKGLGATGVTKKQESEELPGFLKQGFGSEYAFEQYKIKLKEMADYTKMQTDLVKGFYQDMAISIGTALGEVMAGNGGVEKIFAAVASSLGNFAIQLGGLLIAQGVAVEAFKESLKSLQGGMAIIAGIALVATGAAFKAFASKDLKLAQGGLAFGPTMAMVGDNRNASTDPEVIAPLSKLQQYLNGASTVRVEVVGTIKGRDIYFSQVKETKRRKLIGA